MDGVWTEPVTAQVMMTLRLLVLMPSVRPLASEIFDIAVDADRLPGDVAGQVRGRGNSARLATSSASTMRRSEILRR